MLDAVFLSSPRMLSTPISLNCALMLSSGLGLKSRGPTPPSFQEERLQTEMSAKLCFFAAKG
jgi:hypothetical protein